jgi:hypothetical protein
MSVEDDTASPGATGPSGPQQEHGHGKQWDDEESGVVDESVEGEPSNRDSVVRLMIEVRGTKSYPKLVARIADIPEVISVQAGDNTTE